MRNKLFLVGLCPLIVASCSVAPQQTSISSSLVNAISCPALPGADTVLAMRDKQFFIFGELHGTSETPEIFGDFVCAAAMEGPVIVGLELESAQQGVIDRYLSSDGSAGAREELLRSNHWSRIEDGRASEAMFRLVERLRFFKAAGLQVRIAAFIPVVSDRRSQTPYEMAMATAWRDSIRSTPGARFVALVGSIHARRSPVYGFEPAAMHMPQEVTLTLGHAPTGGSAWNCQQDGCGPHPVDETGVAVARGIVEPAQTPLDAPRYDRWFSVGRPFTASSPIWSGEGR